MRLKRCGQIEWLRTTGRTPAESAAGFRAEEPGQDRTRDYILAVAWATGGAVRRAQLVTNAKTKAQPPPPGPAQPR